MQKPGRLPMKGDQALAVPGQPFVSVIDQRPSLLVYRTWSSG